MHFAVFAVVGKNPEHKDTGVLPQPTDKPIVEPPIPPAYGKKKSISSQLVFVKFNLYT